MSPSESATQRSSLALESALVRWDQAKQGWTQRWRWASTWSEELELLALLALPVRGVLEELDEV